MTITPENRQWSIQNGEFKVDPKDAPTPSTKIFVISPTTGLIGAPTKTKTGVRFTCLLNPKLFPESHISLQSSSINGIYKIKSAVHTGNARDGQWQTEVEAVTI